MIVSGIAVGTDIGEFDETTGILIVEMLVVGVVVLSVWLGVEAADVEAIGIIVAIAGVVVLVLVI